MRTRRMSLLATIVDAAARRKSALLLDVSDTEEYDARPRNDASLFGSYGYDGRQYTFSADERVGSHSIGRMAGIRARRSEILSTR